MVEEYKKLKKANNCFLLLCAVSALVLFVVLQCLDVYVIYSLYIVLLFELLCIPFLVVWRIHKFSAIFEKRMIQMSKDCQIQSYLKEVMESIPYIKNPLERKMLTFMIGSGYMYLDDYEQALMCFMKLSKEKLSKGQRFQNDVCIANIYMYQAANDMLKQQLLYIQKTHDLGRLRKLEKLKSTFQSYERLQCYVQYNQKEITWEQVEAYECEASYEYPLQRLLFLKRFITLWKDTMQDSKLVEYQAELATFPKDAPCNIEVVQYEIVDNKFKRKAQLRIFVALIIQIMICFCIHTIFFAKQMVFTATSSNEENVVELYKEKTNSGTQYKLILKQKDSILSQEVLRDFRKVKSKDWINDTIMMFCYVDTNYKDVVRTYDFSNKGKQANLESLRKAANNQLEKEKAQTKKKLSKSDPIKTETGYKLHDMNHVFVTYDYGKHWKDTDISSHDLTFSTGTQLRLSEESYFLSKNYSYFYYTDGHGYLNYTYSLDEGEHWTRNQYEFAAFDASWFQAVNIDIQHPSFFMSDKNAGTLSYYTSSDQGATFQQQVLQVEGGVNLISDTSYVIDGLLFVSFYEDQKIYRSEDNGRTFEVITPPNNEDIRNFLGPLLQEGMLNMSAYTTKGKSVIYTSNDMGKTWNRI